MSYGPGNGCGAGAIDAARGSLACRRTRQSRCHLRAPLGDFGLTFDISTGSVAGRGPVERVTAEVQRLESQPRASDERDRVCITPAECGASDPNRPRILRLRARNQ